LLFFDINEDCIDGVSAIGFGVYETGLAVFGTWELCGAKGDFDWVFEELLDFSGHKALKIFMLGCRDIEEFDECPRESPGCKRGFLSPNCSGMFSMPRREKNPGFWLFVSCLSLFCDLDI
jgi:hypothetical protein